MATCKNCELFETDNCDFKGKTDKNEIPCINFFPPLEVGQEVEIDGMGKGKVKKVYKKIVNVVTEDGTSIKTAKDKIKPILSKELQKKIKSAAKKVSGKKAEDSGVVQDFQKATKDLHTIEFELHALQERMSEELDKVHKLFDSDLMQKAQEVAQKREEIINMIKSSTGIFKPKAKTMVLNGIKVGMAKKAQGITWNEEDEEAIIEKLKKHKNHEVLLKTTHKIVKTTLKALPKKEIEDLGITIVPAHEEAVIKNENSLVEKLVGKYMTTLMKETGGK